MSGSNSPQPQSAKPLKIAEKRRRTTFNSEQRQLLEAQFHCNPYPDKADRKRLAAELRVKDSSITWWFGHRRAKEVKNKKHALQSEHEQHPSDLHHYGTLAIPSATSLAGRLTDPAHGIPMNLPNFDGHPMGSWPFPHLPAPLPADPHSLFYTPPQRPSAPDSPLQPLHHGPGMPVAGLDLLANSAMLPWPAPRSMHPYDRSSSTQFTSLPNVAQPQPQRPAIKAQYLLSAPVSQLNSRAVSPPPQQPPSFNALFPCTLPSAVYTSSSSSPQQTSGESTTSTSQSGHSIPIPPSIGSLLRGTGYPQGAPDAMRNWSVQIPPSKPSDSQTNNSKQGNFVPPSWGPGASNH